MNDRTSTADDVAQLREMAREFTEGFNSGDVDRIMRFYGETYVDVNLRHPVQSKSERKKYYENVMRRRGIRINAQPDEILVEGDFAFVRGKIEIQSASGEAKTSELRYLEIARKANGFWTVMWGMDGPVQEYDPAE